MKPELLPHPAPLAAYEQQAAQLLEAHRQAEPWAIEVFHSRHPRFLDPDVKWKPADLTPGEIENAALTMDDARLALARSYDFRDWAALEEYTAAVADPSSPVRRFEDAVEAVIAGDIDALRQHLAADPDLVLARSTRITHFDPPIHGATLLHYIAANGVEGHRQRTPANAVDIAVTLLEAGADPNALASMYGGQCTVLSMLVSSCHPAEAGVQIALAETLLDHGAFLTDTGQGNWVNPAKTALVFGYVATAQALVRRGAPVDLPVAAGTGDTEAVSRLLPASDAALRHSALAIAAQSGHAPVVALLLDAGEDPDRYNPPAHHAHSTPLHQAALAGNLDVVRILVERGARLDIKDTLWHATPAGWAAHSGESEVEAYLRQFDPRT